MTDREDSREVRKWINEGAAIRQRIKIAEKERQTHFLAAKRVDLQDEFSQLLEEERQADLNRDTEERAMRLGLAHVRQSVGHLSDAVGAAADVAALPALKAMMDAVEKELFAFKQQQRNRYDDLVASENELSRELAGFEEVLRMAEREAPFSEQALAAQASAATQAALVSLAGARGSPSRSPEGSRTRSGRLSAGQGSGGRAADDAVSDSDDGEGGDGALSAARSGSREDVVARIRPATSLGTSRKPLPVEVQEFEDYVHVHGLYGGWDEAEHGRFLKLHARIELFHRLVDAVMAELPNRSEEEIKQHIHWYNKLVELQEHRKEAIARWRQRRIASQAKRIDAAEPTKEEIVEAVRAKEAARRRLAEEQRKRIQEWKEERARQAAEEERARLEVEEAQRQRVAAEEKRKREAAQQVLAAARAAREREERESVARSEAEAVAEPRRRPSSAQLLLSRERALNEAVERRERIRARQEQLVRRIPVTEEPREPVAPTAADWARLAQPNVRAGPRDEERPAFSRVLPKGPMRAVPTWRKGL